MEELAALFVSVDRCGLAACAQFHWELAILQMAAARVIEIKGAVSADSRSVPVISEGETAAYVELTRALAKARVSAEFLGEESARTRFDEVAALPPDDRYGIKAAPFEAFRETFKQTVEVRLLAASALSLCSTTTVLLLEFSRYALEAHSCPICRPPGTSQRQCLHPRSRAGCAPMCWPSGPRPCRSAPPA